MKRWVVGVWAWAWLVLSAGAATAVSRTIDVGDSTTVTATYSGWGGRVQQVLASVHFVGRGIRDDFADGFQQ